MNKEEHIMILHIHAGILSPNDSTSLTNQIFTNLEKCQEACNQAKNLVKGTTKSYKCICVKK